MEKYFIRDGNRRDYFTQIPNIVAHKDLDPYTFRLYFHLKMVCGEDGQCWQSAETIAQETGISERKISDCKKELVTKNLIEIENKVSGTGSYQLITICDIWKENSQYFNGIQGGSALQASGVMHEAHTNNIPINNTTVVMAKPKPVKQTKLSKKDFDDAEKIVKAEWANSRIAKEKENTLLPEQFHQQASWFMQYTGLSYLPKFRSLWISGFEEWNALHVEEEDVMKAVQKLQSNGLSIISPGSLTKTLNGIVANRKKPNTYNPWS
jgi:hypothetical protein